MWEWKEGLYLYCVSKHMNMISLRLVEYWNNIFGYELNYSSYLLLLNMTNKKKYAHGAPTENIIPFN